MKGRIQHPFLTAAVLKAANPVLLAGEVVYESDSGRHKVGDGVKAWNALPYAGGGNFDGNIPAARIEQDDEHLFVSGTEKTAWNNKAATDLSNVTLTKLLSDNGYYKAPDGLMFQWGTRSGNSNGTHTVYFPTSFYAAPPIVLAVPSATDTAYSGSISCYITAKTTSYFSAILNWKEGGSQGRSGWPLYWFALGRWK